MTQLTIPLDGKGLRNFSQTQCQECGSTVFIEAEVGSRIALVCLRTDRFSAVRLDPYGKYHDWSVYAGQEETGAH